MIADKRSVDNITDLAKTCSNPVAEETTVEVARRWYPRNDAFSSGHSFFLISALLLRQHPRYAWKIDNWVIKAPSENSMFLLFFIIYFTTLFSCLQWPFRLSA
jgi:hypothetical protein